MRGLKHGSRRPRRPGSEPGRAIRPAYEGIETFTILRSLIDILLTVARSAPPMRGLKPHHELLNGKSRYPLCRAIRPAYEGIETRRFTLVGVGVVVVSRAIRPAYEGIETQNLRDAGAVQI